MDFLEDYQFTQIVDFILDIHATNRPSLIVSYKPVSGIIDHEEIFTYSFLTVDIQPHCKRKAYIAGWARADWNQISDMAKSVCNSN